MMNERIIAEINQANFAWGRVYKGSIITNNNVYKYDLSEDSKASNSTKEYRLSKSTKTNALSATTRNRIIRLSKQFYGTNAELTSHGADMGEHKIIIYDDNGAPWLMSQTGDRAGTVPGTSELIRLLDSINDREVDNYPPPEDDLGDPRRRYPRRRDFEDTYYPVRYPPQVLQSTPVPPQIIVQPPQVVVQQPQTTGTVTQTSLTNTDYLKYLLIASCVLIGLLLLERIISATRRNN